MNTTPRNVATALTYMGALPFSLLMLAPETVLGVNTASVFLSYGAVISSFMAGTLWGTQTRGRGDVLVIVTSNVFALVAFATLVLGLSVTALLMQMVLFGFLLLADYRTLARRDDQRWYWKLRLQVTMVVAVAYCVMLIDRAVSVSG
jgi:signal transduction histidine kinase